jgi:type I restriction enzyme S subunit
VSKDWQQIILRDICTQIDYGYTAKAQSEPVGPKFLRITDIVPDLIDWDSVPYCEIGDEKLGKYKLQQGDIVIARTGATTGYAKWIRESQEAVFASYLVRLRIGNEHDSRYIGYVVESQEYKRFIQANLSGAAQPNANAQVLTSFPLGLPPFPIQRRIAAILSAYDDLIENNTRRIAALEAAAQALYREWFVEFRFPGHEETEWIEAELGVIPAGWKVVQLGDVIELAYGKGLTKDNRVPGPFPVYGSSGVVGSHTEYLVEGPGIIVGRKGNVGSIFWSDDNFYPIDTVFFVKTDLSLHYLYYNLQHQNFVDTDTAVPGLSRNQAYLLPFVVPDDDTTSLFSELVDPIFEQRRTLELKNAALRETRDLLLPRLISGELDVAELPLPGEEVD